MGFRVARSLSDAKTVKVDQELAATQGKPPPESGSMPSAASKPPPPQQTPAEKPTSENVSASKPAGPAATLTNSIGMKLVLIPAGEFLMGSPDSDSDAQSNEKPQHRVQISRPFYLGVYEVTQAEYEKVMGTNPSQFKECGPRGPVEIVSWDDAQVFCQKLSALADEQAAGWRYRLPTEAEWEYACRAGSTSRFSCGDDYSWLDNYAWSITNSGSKTHPVGEKKPNAWGLYDMHGNVWEWCLDWRSDYTPGEQKDPCGPLSGPFKVLRGGSWQSPKALCRSATRHSASRYESDATIGFRVALAPEIPGVWTLAAPPLAEGSR
jgi:formylglycine-generating enzyme required for sulfatase activity